MNLERKREMLRMDKSRRSLTEHTIKQEYNHAKLKLMYLEYH